MSNQITPSRIDIGSVCIEDLVEEFYPVVYQLCLNILDDPDEADDATQETFIAACTRMNDYRQESTLKTWVYAIAINACRGLLRKRGRRNRLLGLVSRVQLFFGHNPSTEDLANVADRNQHLWAAVDRLDEKHRLTILLRYAHNLPCSEIAQILGINEGTVQSRLHYARKTLAGWLIREENTSESISEVQG
ncbi:MAG: RNA polymerase sigma factor [Anaerolineaceae bacterium]|nr:RNA polymerase sigma factor [Anaerolineaceae bacterium]